MAAAKQRRDQLAASGVEIRSEQRDHRVDAGLLDQRLELCKVVTASGLGLTHATSSS
jgi:hypothetical protein